jgi:hypothetical protein
MHSIKRFCLGTVCSAAVLAVGASSAMAAQVASTLPATHVTAKTAVLNGQVATAGLKTAWEFQWGRTTKYGNNTAAQTIPAGQGTRHVSVKISGLKPNTTYHFRLVTTTVTGNYHYPVITQVGRDRTFHTKRIGALILLSKRLRVHHHHVAIPLKCASPDTCNGRVTIVTKVKVKGKIGKQICAVTGYTIRAGKKKVLHPKVKAACYAKLRHARHHRIRGKATARPRTGQKGFIEHVTLKLT